MSASEDAAFLQLTGLRKRYDQGGGVDEVNLAVARGTMLVLLGPSGSGKTTLLRSIAGLEQPDAGAVLLEGTDLSGVPVHKRNIGMVFQTWALFPHMTVLDNVGFGLRMAGVTKKEIDRRAKEALELVHMAEFAGRRPDQLSGGQQQRVALARAIVTRPKLLLFDEPLSSLDQKIRLELRAQLRQIQLELSFTGVYVTHDHAEALALADRIVVMNGGRVIEQGSPLEMFTAPKHAFTADFLSVGATFELVGADDSDNSVLTREALRIHLPQDVSAVGAATSSKNLLIPARAVSILGPVESVSDAAPNVFAGEVVSIEFEHTGLLCTVALASVGVLVRSIEPLDSVIAVGDRVAVSLDAVKFSLVETA